MKTYWVGVAAADGTAAHLHLVLVNGGRVGDWTAQDAQSEAVLGSAGGRIIRWDRSGAILEVNSGTLVLSGMRKNLKPGSPDASGVGVYWVKHGKGSLPNGDVTWVCTSIQP